MNEKPQTVFTIGHSTHSAERFLGMLRQHGIEAVADVRSSPYSRFNPQFNREILERSLKEAGLRYVFLGTELGARSGDPSCYENGRVHYARLAQSAIFQAGLARVEAGAQRYRIALMCAEKEPLDCHRAILVARALQERGRSVLHILADGQLESQEAAMERLLDLTHLPHDDLFRSHEDLLAEALSRQERQVAYVDEQQAAMTLREDSP